MEICDSSFVYWSWYLWLYFMDLDHELEFRDLINAWLAKTSQVHHSISLCLAFLSSSIPSRSYSSLLLFLLLAKPPIFDCPPLSLQFMLHLVHHLILRSCMILRLDIVIPVLVWALFTSSTYEIHSECEWALLSWAGCHSSMRLPIGWHALCWFCGWLNN